MSDTNDVRWKWPWKEGWYVMLDDKPMRGPFEHRETVEILFSAFLVQYHYVRQLLSIQLKTKKGWNKYGQEEQADRKIGSASQSVRPGRQTSPSKRKNTPRRD